MCFIVSYPFHTAFQCYCIVNPLIATITIIPNRRQVTLSGTVQLGRVLNPITISQSQPHSQLAKATRTPNKRNGAHHLLQRTVSKCHCSSRNDLNRCKRHTDCHRSRCDHTSRKPAELWTNQYFSTCHQCRCERKHTLLRH